jgi:nucleotide-binding universal stress UspA family protein
MYTRILVPLDGSETGECVLPYVKWYAQVSDLDELVFLRVVEPFEVTGALEAVIINEEKKRIEGDAVSLARNYLEKIVASFQSPNFRVRAEVIVGKPVRIITGYADKNGVDLIIMATHGFSGVQRVFRGSVADEVLHHARVPVLMITPKDNPPDK